MNMNLTENLWFSYSITSISKPSVFSDYSHSFAFKPSVSYDFSDSVTFQPDPSCEKLYQLIESALDGASIGTIFKLLIRIAFGNGAKLMDELSEQNPEIFSYSKICTLSITNEINKMQGCSKY